MPYIKQYLRLQVLRTYVPHNAGEFAFLISQLIVRYIKHKGLSYETLHSIDGILGTSHNEFRRRVLNPYEDQKIKENGDVYDELDIPKST